MNTPISTKLAALGLALFMNAAMLGTVGYLFSREAHAQPTVALAALAQNPSSPLV